MIHAEELLAVFERKPCWEWVRRHFLPAALACPRCGATITGEKPRRSFIEMRRTFCQGCGAKFTPTEGTPLHGTRWRPEELVRLLVLHLAGREPARIAPALGKSPASVRDMMDRVNLVRPGFLEDRGIILPRSSQT